MITEHPIPFTTAMTRAILAGHKTQTRRVMKQRLRVSKDGEGLELASTCPYGAAGHRLWVKETWANAPTGFIYRADFRENDQFGSEVVELSTGKTVPLVWKSSRFMPKKVARLWLELVSIRVERIQEISEADCSHEGIMGSASLAERFSRVWDDINCKRGYGWDSDPWVWVIEFRRVP